MPNRQFTENRKLILHPHKLSWTGSNSWHWCPHRLDVLLEIWVLSTVGLWVGKELPDHHVWNGTCPPPPPSTSSPLQGCTTACTVPTRAFENADVSGEEVNHCSACLPRPVHGLAGGRSASFCSQSFPCPTRSSRLSASPRGLSSFAPWQANSKGPSVCIGASTAHFSQGDSIPAIPINL